MVFLLPASPAHAGTPTVSLSTETSGVLTAATSGAVASSLVITGKGFTPAAIIKVYSTVGSSTVTWLTAGTCTTVNSGTGTANSLTTTAAGSTCLTTTASGGFQVTATVPAMPGGAQTITVSDGVSTINTPFSISASITAAYTNNNFGFPQQSLGSSTFSVTGFGASETVTFASTAFTTASFAATTCTTNTVGSCSVVNTLIIADQNGGSKTITATGGTSLLTASTSITVSPWAAFYTSAAGKTSFSFVGSAPTSVLIEAHGLAAGTIAANSITVGGVGTSHTSVTVGSSGAFGGSGGQLVVAPTAQVPFGQVNVVIGGVTFNYATGNIALGAGTWGGVLISSIAGIAASSTGVMTVNSANYQPATAASTTAAPAADTVAFFGYGFVPNTGCGASTGGVITLTTPASLAFSSAPTFNAGVGGAAGGSGVAKPDCNGALFGTGTMGDTPFSTAATPTVGTQYTETIAQAAGPANVLSPSFGVTPWISTPTITTVDFTTASEAFTVHGFSVTEGVTATIGGSTLALTTCTTGATGTATCTASGTVPDLASGSQSLVAKGSLSGASGTGTVTYDPNVSGAGALSLNSGAPGTTTILRTGTTYGPHGLAANTAYNIVWSALGGPTTVGSFTSTATGGVPIPGVQFTVPSDAAGYHTIDIQTASGATAIYGGTKAGDTAPSISATLKSQYGDMIFSLTGLLSATPGVATIGAPETLSGGGLSAGTSYVIALGTGAGTVSTTAPALALFTATSAGAVPAGTTITLADTATTTETGTVKYMSVQTAAHFGTTTVSDAYAQFVLAASATNNMTTAPAGHSVTLSAHALNGAGAIYNLIFNYVQSPLSSTSYSGTTVGVLAPNTVGAGSIQWNVPPNTPAGSYPVQLVVSTVGAGGLAIGSAVLDIPLTFTVGGTSGSCANEGTACMSIAGTPSTSKSGANTIISATFTNNSNAPQTAYIYAVVHNALGQTVYYTTATVSPAAGGSQAGQLVLFGLPPGTYSATVFAVSTSGTAISTTTSVTVTI